MTYISVEFIYFLIVFLIIYYVFPKQWMKRFVLLAGNICFYIWAGGDTLLVVIASALVVYFCSGVIDKIYAGYREEATSLSVPQRLKLFKDYKRKTIYIVIGALALLLCTFAYVKIGRYLGMESVSLAQFSMGRNVIIPLGVSYYTLSMIGYLLDVYHDRIVHEKNILSFITCVTYFPHIVQGPISKYGRLLDQLKELPAFSYDRMCSGLQLMLWGYLKKLVLADTIALYTTQVFSHAGGYSVRSIAVATVLYAIQLYADFSGCIDIVSGVSEVIGISLDKNFERPFFSVSAGEFWRRWHISLGNWFKEYIYMPIATSSRFKDIVKKIRKKQGRQWGVVVSVAVPSLAVWILTGIWHGTGMDYILWGLYWGTIIIFSEIWSEHFGKIRNALHIKEQSFIYKLFRQGRTFCIYCVGLLIIMSSSIVPVSGNIERTLAENATIVIGTILLFVVECIQERISKQGLTIRMYLAKQPLVLRWLIWFGGMLLLVIYGRFGLGYNADAFIYAGF